MWEVGMLSARDNSTPVYIKVNLCIYGEVTIELRINAISEITGKISTPCCVLSDRGIQMTLSSLNRRT